MAEVEALEIFEEVETETEVLLGEATGSLEIGLDADALSEDDDIIDISDIMNDALDTVNEDQVGELLEIDPHFLKNIEADVTSSLDTVSTNLREGGVPITLMGEEMGSSISTARAADEAGADAVEGSKGAWYYMKKTGGIFMKVVLVYMVIDFVGKMIASIVSAIKDGTKNPPWKGSLTSDQKSQLEKVQDAMYVLSSIIKEWEEAVKPLQNNPLMSYGTMDVTVGGRKKTVQVIDVVAYLLDDAGNQQTTAHNILKNGIDDLTVLDMTQLENCTFSSFADIQAMIDLRKNKGNVVKNNMLPTYNFPPSQEDVKVSMVLTKDFPKWSDNVHSQGFSLAKMGASRAIGAFTKSQVMIKVNEYLRENVYPVIKRAAKKAGVDAAKSYVSGEKDTIIAKAMIPIVGPDQARSYGKDVRKEAIKRGMTAAKAAGRKKAHEMKAGIEAALKPIVKNLIDTNQENMKQIGTYAAKQIMDTVVAPKST